ncbi:MAG: RsmE family RNA methyltransferase [Pelovirga sp.]
MRLFYLPDVRFHEADAIALPQELRHHLATVLRLGPGAAVQLFDGQGRVAEARLLADGRAELSRVRTCPPPACRMTLIQGLPKGDKTELILQKGTELGVSGFHLVAMERSVGRFKQHVRQQQRREKIIQEAARQCYQYHLPTLVNSDSLAAALAEDEADLKLLLWEESTTALPQVLDRAAPRRISLIVGPEGGISEKEAAAARAQGYQSVRLGPRILRTETAGLAMIAVLQYLYGDLAIGPG